VHVTPDVRPALVASHPAGEHQQRRQLDQEEAVQLRADGRDDAVAGLERPVALLGPEVLWWWGEGPRDVVRERSWLWRAAAGLFLFTGALLFPASNGWFKPLLPTLE
jgi:hypothetical protein